MIPDPSRQPSARPQPGPYDALALTCGILGLMACNNPPLQLLCGAAAVIFSILSRQNRVRTGMSAVGLVTGIISILFSLLLFASFVYVYHAMEDPAIAKQIVAIYQYYMDMMERMTLLP